MDTVGAEPYPDPKSFNVIELITPPEEIPTVPRAVVTSFTLINSTSPGILSLLVLLS